jgi:hypothetical protein
MKFAGMWNVLSAASESATSTTTTTRRGFAVPWLARAILELYPRAIGALLSFTAIQKSLDGSGVARVLEFDRLPQVLVEPVVSAVIVVEAFLGVILMLKPRVRGALDATTCLLALYTIQLAYLALFREAPGCACLAAWEAYKSARVQNLLGIGRNVCLVLPLAWVRWQLTSPRRSDTSAAST